MTAEVTVLGIGNSIMGDDAIGLELLAVVSGRRPDPRVSYVDGGTSGMELVPVVQEARRLLVLDAVAAASAPGSVVRVGGDQVPRLLAAKLSPHQVGLLDVLAAVRLLGSEPDAVEVVGIVPADVNLRLGLSPEVANALAEAAAVAESVLDEWLA